MSKLREIVAHAASEGRGGSLEMTGATKMATTIELKFTLRPEKLEGGYTRYTTEDLPGFRLLCEPEENPIPLLEKIGRAHV